MTFEKTKRCVKQEWTVGKTIGNKKKQLGKKSIINTFDEKMSEEAKNWLFTLNNLEKRIEYKKISSRRDNNLEFDFIDYKYLMDFWKKFNLEIFQQTGQKTHTMDLIMY